MTKQITLVEVGPRDGLQNESIVLDQTNKEKFIRRLCLAGLKRIEIGAFVSPKWVPQMEGSLELAQTILAQQKKNKISKDIFFSALVPNTKGMEIALLSGIQEVAFFTAASTNFTQKNINCSVSESLNRLKNITKMLPKKCLLRGYISTAFYCPYEGYISPHKVVQLATKLIEMGCYEISIGDTIGAASPKEVNQLLSVLLKIIPPHQIAMHFHDTRGLALTNIKESLDHGISVFDSSLGGLGGCPYSKHRVGNVATEIVVYFLERLGYQTGVNLNSLIKINHWLARKFGRSLPFKTDLFKSNIPPEKLLKV